MTVTRKPPKGAPGKTASTLKGKSGPTDATPEVERAVLRKKELIERVVARSGVKKKDAKPAIEAMLAVLGEALAAGEDLNLQPLGKVMVKRTNQQKNAKVMVCRIRQRLVVDDGTVVKITS